TDGCRGDVQSLLHAIAIKQLDEGSEILGRLIGGGVLTYLIPVLKADQLGMLCRLAVHEHLCRLSEHLDLRRATLDVNLLTRLLSMQCLGNHRGIGSAENRPRVSQGTDSRVDLLKAHQRLLST